MRRGRQKGERKEGKAGSKGNEDSGGRGGNRRGRGGECELFNPTFTTAFIKCLQTFYQCYVFSFLTFFSILFLYVFMHLCLNYYEYDVE